MAFERTVTSVTTDVYYALQGYQAIKNKSYMLAPVSAKFTFHNGVFVSLLVTGAMLLKDGSHSERLVRIQNLHAFNRDRWPVWLEEICQDAQEGIVTSSDG